MYRENNTPTTVNASANIYTIGVFSSTIHLHPPNGLLFSLYKCRSISAIYITNMTIARGLRYITTSTKFFTFYHTQISSPVSPSFH